MRSWMHTAYLEHCLLCSKCSINVGGYVDNVLALPFYKHLSPQMTQQAALLNLTAREQISRMVLDD